MTDPTSPQSPLEPPPGPASSTTGAIQHVPAADPKVVDDGRMWAYIAYASFFVGVPAFIVPLAQRDNAFALLHARHAAVSYGLGIIAAVIITVIALVTCGVGAILMPLILFPWVTAIHGFMLVSRGEWREPILCFGLADRFLGTVTVKEGPSGTGGPAF